MKYSVLTYIFNNGDTLREVPQEKDVEYICVTDNPSFVNNNKGWKIIIDDSLKEFNSEYASFYVRHHPFKYCSGDVCIRIDGSIQIKKSLLSLFQEFDNTDFDVCVMTNSRAVTIEEELWHWRCPIHKEVKEKQVKWYKDLGIDISKDGCIQSPITITRNNDVCNQCDVLTWKFINELSTPEVTARPSQVMLTAAMSLLKDLKIMFVDEKLIQSDTFQWCHHNSEAFRQSFTIIKHTDFFDNPVTIHNFKDVRYNDDILRREVEKGKSLFHLLHSKKFPFTRQDLHNNK